MLTFGIPKTTGMFWMFRWQFAPTWHIACTAPSETGAAARTSKVLDGQKLVFAHAHACNMRMHGEFAEASLNKSRVAAVITKMDRFFSYY
jgi:hypothetical protein